MASPAKDQQVKAERVACVSVINLSWVSKCHTMTTHTHTLMYLCMYVCMYVCMSVCVCVCMYINIRLSAHFDLGKKMCT